MATEIQYKLFFADSVKKDFNFDNPSFVTLRIISSFSHENRTVNLLTIQHELRTDKIGF